MERIEQILKREEMSQITNQIFMSRLVKVIFDIDFGGSLLEANKLLDEINYATDKDARIYVYLNNHQYYLDNCSYQDNCCGYSYGMYKMESKIYTRLL